MAAKKWRTNLYLPKEYEAILKAWAAEEDRSVNKLVTLIVKRAIEARRISPQPQSTMPTFIDLLKEKDLTAISVIAQIPIERISAIANGERPTNEELIGLSRALGKTSDELKEIRRAYFNNENGIKENVRY